MDPSSACSFSLRAGLIGLLFLPSTEVDGGVSATCGGCMVLSLWSLRRWRDAMFEGPSGRSRGRTKFAEPSNGRAVRFIQRWSKKAAIHFLCPFLVCRLPRAQGLTRLIHPFWCARWASKGDQRVDQFRLHRLPPSLPAWHSSRWSCSTILRSGSRFLPPAWPCPMPPDLPLAHGL